MFITLYQLRHGRFVPIKEFYRWTVKLADELDEGPVHGRAAKGKSTKMDCPGCGKEYPRSVIRYDHNCTGTLTDRPAENMRYIKNRRWDPSKGEPDAEGCPVPTAREIRAMYNADYKLGIKVKRHLDTIAEDVDEYEIRDYTNTTATSQPAVI